MALHVFRKVRRVEESEVGEGDFVVLHCHQIWPDEEVTVEIRAENMMSGIFLHG